MILDDSRKPCGHRLIKQPGRTPRFYDMRYRKTVVVRGALYCFNKSGPIRFKKWENLNDDQNMTKTALPSVPADQVTGSFALTVLWNRSILFTGGV